jgi:3-deoxy-7-phosphoheptulonate synthase
MLIIMETSATHQEISTVVERASQMELKAHLQRGTERTVIGVIGDTRTVVQDQFRRMSGVEGVVPITKPYKLASREFQEHDTVFDLNGVQVGSQEVIIMAGPCSVEDRSQILETAHAVREAGAHLLRGGAFKPRSSPYSFQGLGVAGLELLAEAREMTGLAVVTEVMSPDKVEVVTEYADVLQIGARNMQNYPLLHAVGASQHPVLLKRALSGTIDELLMSAEYVLSHGNRKVMLCERGIRTYETSTRNTTDINAVPVLKSRTHLPVILDPSHSVGHWEWVAPIARAGIAAGADGLIIEVHPEPHNALSDGGQSLKPERFAAMVREAVAIAEAIGRTVPPPPEATKTLEESMAGVA